MSLLRGHVGNRSDDCSGVGQIWFGRSGQRRKFGSALQSLSQTKVEQLRMAVCRDEDVGRFNIAMNDALRVGLFQTIRNLNSEIDNFFDREGSSRNPLLQRLSFQELH